MQLQYTLFTNIHYNKQVNKWEQAKNELEKAYQARKNGNEGMARVCARRAANFALQAYLEGTHQEIPSQNVIHLLNDPQIRLSLPGQLQPILNHLLQKVNENYQFDPRIDLLSETHDLLTGLQNILKKVE